MGGFDHLRVGQVSEGYWGAHTSSIDWCEENYTYSPYIAEFVNTLSNIPFICLGLYGYYRVLHQGLPRRYGYLMLGLSVIGGGSGLFHMTLQWFWQLMDELPMIYLVTYCGLLVFDTSPEFNTRLGGLAMLALDLFVTVSYIRAPNPIYHQVAFGSLQLVSVSRIIYLIKYRLPPSSEHPAKKVIGDMLFRGVALFGIAFLIWNLDNLFCDTWRSLRVQVAPFGFMLEGHAFWHLGTGLGSYWIMTAATYLCLCVKTGVKTYEIKGSYLFPYVAPTSQASVSGKSEPLKDATEKTPILRNASTKDKH